LQLKVHKIITNTNPKLIS